MIVEFSVSNFRSIKEMQTISFAASKLDSSKENAQVDINNVVEEGGVRLLKTVGIYGANASGKSNVIRAFEYFVEFIGSLPSPQSQLYNLSDPNIYQKDIVNSESFFQVVFVISEKKYRYGFTIKNDAIFSEWLYGTHNKNMVPYFIRSGGKSDIDIKDIFKEARDVPSLELKHNLFLTHVASYRKSTAGDILEYFRQRTMFSYMGMQGIRYNTINFLKTKDYKKHIIKFLSSFNHLFIDIIIDSEQENDIRNPIPLDKIIVVKSIKDERGQLSEIKLNLGNTESSGTQKLFDLSGTIFASLVAGTCFIVDELDSNFHPALLIKLISMFNDPKINTGNGQLLFTTHDTNLLDPAIMRRDQFYFTEKNEQEATRLYSLADLKGIRNDADFARQYLAGFYGALPVLSTYAEKAVPHE